MKKTILAIVCCLALTACEPTTISHEQWQQEQDRKVAPRITKFNYEGHSYLLYQHEVGTRWGVAGICHDENCPCKTKAEGL